MSELSMTNPGGRTGAPINASASGNTPAKGTKTLVFSVKPGLEATPAGYMGCFKMLCLETGQLYNYRVHVSNRPSGPCSAQERSRENDIRCQQKMFFALTVFLKEYHAAYGSLPVDSNVYHDGRRYTDSGDFFGKKIWFKVTENDLRDLTDKQLALD
jgi:hypothetical protein